MKVGDRILFGKYSGTEIRVDGEDYLIVSEETDILAKLSGAAKAARAESNLSLAQISAPSGETLRGL